MHVKYLEQCLGHSKYSTITCNLQDDDDDGGGGDGDDGQVQRWGDKKSNL